jgi:hypothetical protein
LFNEFHSTRTGSWTLKALLVRQYRRFLTPET